MLYRCNKVGKKYYKDRGITVCKNWLKFTNFLSDMGERKEGTTIDRINCDGNYSKKNCRWANHKEQARNRRNNNLIDGKTLSEWSEEIGIKRSTLAQRFYVYGWSNYKTLNTPVGKNNHLSQHFGK